MTTKISHLVNLSMFKNEYSWGTAVKENTTDEFHQKFDTALNEVKNDLGKDYPIIINGKKIHLSEKYEVKSPADTNIILGRISNCSKVEIKQAVDASKVAFEEWRSTQYQSRAKVFKECADSFSSKKFYLAALLSIENGKNRYEAIGDIDEAIDFMRFYAYQLELNKGFEKETAHPNPDEKTKVTLKPYGVWGIISPFNFPSAIAIGMTTAALITGNTTVLKPSYYTPISSFKFVEEIYEKIPAGAINFVTGPGDVLGQALMENSDVSGIAFTGSVEVGMACYHKFIRDSVKPFVCEMGGKNPVIVTQFGNLDKAANGVLNAAFGYGGQKCSACSRVYVHKSIYAKFNEMLKNKTSNLKIGLPWKKEVFLGPLIHENAYKRFKKALEIAKRDGEIIVEGSMLEGPEFQNGYYVQPTIVSQLPHDHELMKDELFLPLICINEYDSFDKVIQLANESEFGLTAGIFSENENELSKFFDKIEAGLLYANRDSSATTGALVQIQPFVGWKKSGITGKGAGGENYLQQFMRAQTQTRCERINE